VAAVASFILPSQQKLLVIPNYYVVMEQGVLMCTKNDEYGSYMGQDYLEEINGKGNLGRLKIQETNFKTRIRKLEANCGGCRSI
jgi:hypothetical protein